jgi:hypothetical protein
MPGPQPAEIKLEPVFQRILQKIARQYTNPYWLGVCAKIVLYAAESANNVDLAHRLDTDEETMARWRTRWIAATARLSAEAAAAMPEKDLRAWIENVLSDEPRPGTPDTFQPEQLVQMVAVACSDPRDSAREISHGNSQPKSRSARSWSPFRRATWDACWTRWSSNPIAVATG